MSTGDEKGAGYAAGLDFRDEHNGVAPLALERERMLISLILRYDEDERAAALVELLTGIAYEPERHNRETLGLHGAREAYTYTRRFSEAVDGFATRACLRRKEGKQ